jgi:hypothetical protein
LAEHLDASALERFQRVLATDWVPVEDVSTVYALAAPLLHPGRAGAVRALGRDLARTHLTGIYRVLTRLASVDMVLGQSTRLWSTYNAKGTLRVVASRRGIARLLLEGYPEYPSVVRESLCGYIVGAVELTGATEVRVVQTESPDGWLFEVAWR